MFIAADLLSPNLGLAFWLVVTFLALMILLRRYAWGPITKSLEERERRIADSIQSADRALAEAKQIQADNMKARREADQQAQAILREARESADKLRSDELDKTRTAVQQMQEGAKAEIEREKQNALNELRTEVADLAIQAAGKILDENLDGDRQRRLVDSFLKDLGNN